MAEEAAALANKIEEAGLNIAEDSARDVAGDLLKNVASDVKTELIDIINGMSKDEITKLLTEQGAKQGGDVTELLKNIDLKNSLMSTMAKGQAEIAEAVGEMTTTEAKTVASGASKISDLKSASTKAIADAGGNDSLLTWLKNNPGYALLGMGVTALGLYIAIEAILGVSPADALKKLANLAGDAAREVAAFTGGLANSFASSLFGNIWPYVKWVLIVVGIIVALYVLWKLYHMFTVTNSSVKP